jgi:hypothetical protein
MKKSVSAELPGKIAFTSSLANLFGEIDFDNLNLEKGANYWNPIKGGYANTKLMVKNFVTFYLTIKTYKFIISSFLKKKRMLLLLRN